MSIVLVHSSKLRRQRVVKKEGLHAHCWYVGAVVVRFSEELKNVGGLLVKRLRRLPWMVCWLCDTAVI